MMRWSLLTMAFLSGIVCSCDSGQNNAASTSNAQRGTTTITKDAQTLNSGANTYFADFDEALKSKQLVQTLYLSEYDKRTFSKGITQLENLQSVELRNAVNLDFSHSFQQFGLMHKLNEVKVYNSSLKRYPTKYI